ncbi:hypothetical protein MN608_11520 [Microdochium nivale]|nr:hypothetical protein MN608_11520 [Microdochium nivale]
MTLQHMGPAGSAESVAGLLSSITLRCGHFPGHLANVSAEYPSRLGFFPSSKSDNRVGFLDTQRVCTPCLKTLVPDGYNFWPMSTKLTDQTNKTTQSVQGPGSDQDCHPFIFSIGTETPGGLQYCGGLSPNVLAVQELVRIPIPNVPEAKEAWSWLVSERRPFYMNQLHLVHGWSPYAQVAAAFDFEIAKQHGTAYKPAPTVSPGIFSSSKTSEVRHRRVAHVLDARRPVQGQAVTESQKSSQSREPSGVPHCPQIPNHLQTATHLPVHMPSGTAEIPSLSLSKKSKKVTSKSASTPSTLPTSHPSVTNSKMAPEPPAMKTAEPASPSERVVARGRGEMCATNVTVQHAIPRKPVKQLEQQTELTQPIVGSRPSSIKVTVSAEALPSALKTGIARANAGDGPQITKTSLSASGATTSADPELALPSQVVAPKFVTLKPEAAKTSSQTASISAAHSAQSSSGQVQITKNWCRYSLIGFDGATTLQHMAETSPGPQRPHEHPHSVLGVNPHIAHNYIDGNADITKAEDLIKAIIQTESIPDMGRPPTSRASSASTVNPPGKRVHGDVIKSSRALHTRDDRVSKTHMPTQKISLCAPMTTGDLTVDGPMLHHFAPSESSTVSTSAVRSQRSDITGHISAPATEKPTKIRTEATGRQADFPRPSNAPATGTPSIEVMSVPAYNAREVKLTTAPRTSQLSSKAKGSQKPAVAVDTTHVTNRPSASSTSKGMREIVPRGTAKAEIFSTEHMTRERPSMSAIPKVGPGSGSREVNKVAAFAGVHATQTVAQSSSSSQAPPVLKVPSRTPAKPVAEKAKNPHQMPSLPNQKSVEVKSNPGKANAEMQAKPPSARGLNSGASRTATSRPENSQSNTGPTGVQKREARPTPPAASASKPESARTARAMKNHPRKQHVKEAKRPEFMPTQHNSHNRHQDGRMHQDTVWHKSSNHYVNETHHDSFYEHNISYIAAHGSHRGYLDADLSMTLNAESQLDTGDVATESETSSHISQQHQDTAAEGSPWPYTGTATSADTPVQAPSQLPLQDPSPNPGHVPECMSESTRANGEHAEASQEATTRGGPGGNYDQGTFQGCSQSQYYPQHTTHSHQTGVQQETPASTSEPDKKHSARDNLLALGAGMLAGAAIGAAGFAAYSKLQRNDSDDSDHDPQEHPDNASVASSFSSISSRPPSSLSSDNNEDEEQTKWNDGQDAEEAQSDGESFNENQFMSWDQNGRRRFAQEEREDIEDGSTGAGFRPGSALTSHRSGSPAGSMNSDDAPPAGWGEADDFNGPSSVEKGDDYWRNLANQNPEEEEEEEEEHEQQSPTSPSQEPSLDLESADLGHELDWEEDGDGTEDDNDVQWTGLQISEEEDSGSDSGKDGEPAEGSVYGDPASYQDYSHDPSEEDPESDAESGADADSGNEQSEVHSSVSGDDEGLDEIDDDVSHAYDDDDDDDNVEGEVDPQFSYYGSDTQSISGDGDESGGEGSEDGGSADGYEEGSQVNVSDAEDNISNAGDNASNVEDEVEEMHENYDGDEGSEQGQESSGEGDEEIEGDAEEVDSGSDDGHDVLQDDSDTPEYFDGSGEFEGPDYEGYGYEDEGCEDDNSGYY